MTLDRALYATPCYLPGMINCPLTRPETASLPSNASPDSKARLIFGGGKKGNTEISGVLRRETSMLHVFSTKQGEWQPRGMMGMLPHGWQKSQMAQRLPQKTIWHYPIRSKIRVSYTQLFELLDLHIKESGAYVYIHSRKFINTMSFRKQPKWPPTAECMDKLKHGHRMRNAIQQRKQTIAIATA